MSEIRTLLFLELRSLYSINKYLYTKDRKAKKRYQLLSIAWIYLICMVFFYVGGMVYGMCNLGLSDIVLAYLVVLASLLILAFGIFKAGNRIFGQKGYDILASMPLKSSSIVISRFLSLYVEDLIFSLIIMLPGITVYCCCQKPDLVFYLFAVIGTVFIPAIPLVISTLFGTIVFAISARMKSKSMVQTVLMVALVVGVMLGSFSMGGVSENFTLEQLSDFAQTIGDSFERIYPPAMWFNTALIKSSALSIALFVIASAVLMAVTIIIVCINFHSIVSRLLNITAKHNYKIGTMESRGLLKSLYFREAKRYFSSSIYVTNTIIGPIMGTIMSVALCIVGMDAIKGYLPDGIDVNGFLPFVIAAVFCMMTTTSTAISMEGKQFWIVKSMPIPTKTLLDSKILLNLSLMLPFYILSEIALVIAVRPDIIELMWLLVIPAALMIFSVVFGITVNLKFHSFDWEKEETVVKQSLPAMLGGFAGMLISMLFGGVLFLIPIQYGNIAKLCICVLLLVCTVYLYNKNNTKNLIDL